MMAGGLALVALGSTGCARSKPSTSLSVLLGLDANPQPSTQAQPSPLHLMVRAAPLVPWPIGSTTTTTTPPTTAPHPSRAVLSTTVVPQAPAKLLAPTRETIARPSRPSVTVSPSRPKVAPGTAPAASSGAATVSSTAFCQSGTTASGQQTRAGTVASNSYPLGTVLHVSDSPTGPGDFTVTDRIGSGSQLDFFVNSCSAARAYGRRSVTVSLR